MYFDKEILETDEKREEVVGEWRDEGRARVRDVEGAHQGGDCVTIDMQLASS